MARYQIRQQYFALNDSFDITDSSGSARYTCRSKMISIPKKFWLETASGKPLYFVRKNMIHWAGYPKFKVYKGEDKSGGELATIAVKYSFVGKKIKISSDTFGDYMIPVQGTAMHEYPYFKKQQIQLEKDCKKLGIDLEPYEGLFYKLDENTVMEEES